MTVAQRTINIAGNDMAVEDMEIFSSNETFNEYVLADGSRVKIKGVLTNLARIVGQTLPDGSPFYLATISPVIVPTPPVKK